MPSLGSFAAHTLLFWSLLLFFSLFRCAVFLHAPSACVSVLASCSTIFLSPSLSLSLFLFFLFLFQLFVFQSYRSPPFRGRSKEKNESFLIHIFFHQNESPLTAEIFRPWGGVPRNFESESDPSVDYRRK